MKAVLAAIAVVLGTLALTAPIASATPVDTSEGGYQVDIPTPQSGQLVDYIQVKTFSCPPSGGPSVTEEIAVLDPSRSGDLDGGVVYGCNSGVESAVVQTIVGRHPNSEHGTMSVNPGDIIKTVISWSPADDYWTTVGISDLTTHTHAWSGGHERRAYDTFLVGATGEVFGTVRFYDITLNDVAMATAGSEPVPFEGEGRSGRVLIQPSGITASGEGFADTFK
jgi:hypothetical protein